MNEQRSLCGQLLPNWIDGGPAQAVGAPALDVTNPSTGQVIAQVPLGSAAQVDEAVRSARGAFASWSSTPVPQRAKIMHAYRALLSENFESLAELTTQGVQELLER